MMKPCVSAASRVSGAWTGVRARASASRGAVRKAGIPRRANSARTMPLAPKSAVRIADQTRSTGARTIVMCDSTASKRGRNWSISTRIGSARGLRGWCGPSAVVGLLAPSRQANVERHLAPVLADERSCPCVRPTVIRPNAASLMQSTGPAPSPASRGFEQTVQVETPEHVVLSYSVAGVGSRAAAALIDYALWLVTWIIVYNVLAPLFKRNAEGEAE